LDKPSREWKPPPFCFFFLNEIGMEHACNVNKKRLENVTQLSDTGLMLGYPKGGLWVKAVRREV
jgi:hypothetical protein